MHAGDYLDGLAVDEEQRIRESAKQLSPSALIDRWVDLRLPPNRCEASFYSQQKLGPKAGALLLVPRECCVDIVLGGLPEDDALHRDPRRRALTSSHDLPAPGFAS
jgi:hypothetical protein